MSEQESTPEPTRNKGGRPPKPDAPKTAEECRRLIATESVKEKPSATKQRLLQTLLESFERQEARTITDTDAKLAATIAENANLQTEIESLRGTVVASQEKCESLTVPYAEFEDAKATRDSLRRDLTHANDNLSLATKATKEAIAARDLAVAAQRTAEQNEAHVRQHLKAEYQKLINPLESALKGWLSGSSIDARTMRYPVNQLMEEFRRLHALAMSAPAPFAPTPVRAVRQATSEELAKAQTDRIEADRAENMNQPRSAEPTGVEHMRERFIPRAPEPEAHRPISGGAEWSDWVK